MTRKRSYYPARKRDQGRECTAKARSEETPQQRKKRLANQKAMDRQRREAQAAKETPEQTEERLANQKEQDRERTAKATPERRVERLVLSWQR